ncbi:MAG: KEOPS complex kinase/ATPase Bud32 [Candidatus Pacearchaeota archaeon]
MEEKIISQGAEAKIKLIENKKVVKERIIKSYRLKILDEKLRKSRTKKERKILEKASKIIDVPKILGKESDFSIEMEYIEGEKISNCLDSFNEEKQKEIMTKIGEIIAKLHKEDIIHGDLTTSNMILKKEKIYVIDFGLSFISKRIEDKAVDLHLIKQALEAKHWKNYENLFNWLLESYKENYKKANEVLERLKKVEKRGRYKGNY